jgi:ABC-type nitrate/sulfonate/bicarbonate transport system substrate-binding protein
MRTFSKRMVLAGLILMMILTCAFAGNSYGAKKLEKVRFGLLPYQDWMPWTLAQELGYFKDEGLDVQFTKFPDDITVGEALAAKEMDIICTNSASGVLLAARFPELRTISLACGFLGYAIMIRPDDVYPKGKFKTYDQFYQEYQGKYSAAEAVKKAVYDTCAQLKGRSIVMDRGTGSNLPLQAALNAANLKSADLNYIDIPDVEGALAFWQGTGDFELGGYPQVISLSKLGAVKLISARELGGTSVILSGEMARADWMKKNMGTVLKIRKVWYRVISDLYTKKPLLDKFAEVANKWQGTNLTADDVQQIIHEITYWPLKNEAKNYFFASDAKWNVMDIYQSSLDFWVNVKKQVKPGSVNLKEFIMAEAINNRI